MKRKVVVVGAGVIGLCAASDFVDRGWEVRVISDRPVEALVSARAAAIWWPYLCEPAELVEKLARRSLHRYRSLASDPSYGVRLVECFELMEAARDFPAWVDEAQRPRRLEGEELAGRAAAGIALTLPFIDAPRFLERLIEGLEDKGVAVERARVTSLDELDATLIVNATGLGARELAQDPTVYAVRGQVQRLRRGTDAPCLIDDRDPESPAYILSRSDEIILGGTAQAADESTEPSAEDEASIRERCAALLPGIETLEVLGSEVGLRPARPRLRLEDEGRVLHCYGHGGSGFTLAWGCAEELLRMARAKELS